MNNAAHYLERPVYKLVMLIECIESFDIWLVQLPAEKPLIYDIQDVLCKSRWEPCVQGYC